MFFIFLLLAFALAGTILACFTNSRSPDTYSVYFLEDSGDEILVPNSLVRRIERRQWHGLYLQRAHVVVDSNITRYRPVMRRTPPPAERPPAA